MSRLLQLLFGNSRNSYVDGSAHELEMCHRALLGRRPSSRLLTRDEAIRQWPFLSVTDFHIGLWCADEGVVVTARAPGRGCFSATVAGLTRSLAS